MSMLGVEGAGMGLPGGAMGALGTAGKTLGAAGLAAGAWYMAYDQNESLKKETGGMGIFDIMGGMWDQGTWDPAKVVNKHLDDQAKEAASHKGSNKPPITEATGTNLSNAAKDMKDAAKAMKDAAAKLRPMTAPIGSR